MTPESNEWDSQAFSHDKPLAVGIDLGTTYSALAYIDPTGQPKAIANAEGDRLTPSVVFFDEDAVIVGKEALKALSSHATNVARCMKRDLGRRFFPRELAGRHFPPEALEAWVLNKLRCDANRVIGEIHSVVVTVPAYFDEVRRKATQDAGYMAGLDVMDILNEPTAAAIAFGFDEGALGANRTRPVRIVVYDLGGGTFDVTVMEIVGREFITLATDGDVRLGGEDWDGRLVDMVAEEFLREHGSDPREDANSLGRLWRECEEAKRTLSVRTKATITCEHRLATSRISVSREQFEERTRDLLDRTLFTTRQTLQAAGMNWSQIDRVLLVGGATRMPAVIERMRQLSGKEPDTSVAADEAVANGAALHARRLLDERSGMEAPFAIRNVNSHSLGVVATDPLSGQNRNAVVIPRNTPLPVQCKRTFKTQKANQSSVLVQIVEGESAGADECIQIGRCTLRDLPSYLPAQTPIEVRFRYEENGRLTVLVKAIGTDRWLQHEIQRPNSLNDSQLDAWRSFVTGSNRSA